MDDQKFINALQNGDLKTLIQIQKSDLHNHATRGGNIRHFLTEDEINQIDWETSFDTLDDMQSWYERYVKKMFSGKDGFEARVRSAFKQATEDHIDPLVLSFGLGDYIHYGSYQLFIAAIKEMRQEEYPSGQFLPEVSFSRSMDPQKALNDFLEVAEFNFFRMIDLTGYEKDSVEGFAPLYQYAKEKGLILKAHVGEFSDAENVLRVCKTLNLDEVQHGNAAAYSQEALNYLREHNIILHLCPSSNLRLKRVDKMCNHPIKQLVENNIEVSINTDDLLIFNSSVSEEYLKLYQSGVMSAEKLNDIRVKAINRYEGR